MMLFIGIFSFGTIWLSIFLFQQWKFNEAKELDRLHQVDQMRRREEMELEERRMNLEVKKLKFKETTGKKWEE